MDKNNIVQKALDTYIINNTNLSPNYRRDAILLKYDLSYNTWEHVLNENNSYFLSILTHSVEKLMADYPNEQHRAILEDVELAEIGGSSELLRSVDETRFAGGQSPNANESTEIEIKTMNEN
jgi:hypothetical protein